MQNILYHFIDSKMSSDKMVLIVGPAVEEFLAGLEKPLKLNEMRIMREPNYVRI